jgi:hypothetical protein
MAKLRAMAAKKRTKNPLNKRESAKVLKWAASDIRQARRTKDDFFRGTAVGRAGVVSVFGPKTGKARRLAKQMADRAYKKNPHIVIDPKDNRIVGVERGHPTQTFPRAHAKAKVAAGRAGRKMIVVAHPYVPKGFKKGVQVSPLFHHYGAVEVDAQGGVTHRNPQKLLTKEILGKIPPLYSQEKLGDAAIAYVKFFTPWSNWTWYATEFDGQDQFFGLVVGQETELGYFSLAELQSIRGPAGLRIERDTSWRPTPLSQIKSGAKSNPRSSQAKRFISGKIPKLIHEGYPQRQAVAIAHSMARKKGFKVNPAVYVVRDVFSGKDLATASTPAEAHAYAAKVRGKYPPGAIAVHQEAARYNKNPLLQTVTLGLGNPPRRTAEWATPSAAEAGVLAYRLGKGSKAEGSVVITGASDAKVRALAKQMRIPVAKASALSENVARCNPANGGHWEVWHYFGGKIAQVSDPDQRRFVTSFPTKKKAEEVFHKIGHSDEANKYKVVFVPSRGKKNVVRCNPAKCNNPKHQHALVWQRAPGVTDVVRTFDRRAHAERGARMLRRQGGKAGVATLRNPKRAIGNPLTRSEAAQGLRLARHAAGHARKSSDKSRRLLLAGEALGVAEAVHRYGPRQAKALALKFQQRAIGNPPSINVPWREGQKIPVEKARAWVRSTGDRELMRQFEAAYRLQVKANTKPTVVVWRTIPIGSPKRLDAVTALVQYGSSPETIYRPPKGSKKGDKKIYRHQWGDGSGREKPVPVLAAPGGKAIIMPMGKGQKVTDWMRG